MTASKRIGTNTLQYAALLGFGVLMVFPFLWMISASLKPEQQVFEVPFRLVPETVTLDNYDGVFNNTRGLNFFRFTINTLIIAAGALALNLTTSAVAGYAFARISFPFRRTLFYLYLANMIIPFQCKMIPLYFELRAFGLLDSLMGIILINAYSAFGVLLLKQFYLTMPGELIDSAKIDGCSNWGVLFRVILPNVKPALATLAVFTFIHNWNDFLGPLLYLASPEKATISLGLRMFQDEFQIEYGKIMAGTSLALIPIIVLYMFLQKYFVKGVATSGIKA